MLLLLLQQLLFLFFASCVGAVTHSVAVTVATAALDSFLTNISTVSTPANTGAAALFILLL